MSASTLNAGSPLMIELFAGSARMAQTFREAGFETFTVDIEELSRDPERQIDLIADVMSLKAEDLPLTPMWCGLRLHARPIRSHGRRIESSALGVNHWSMRHSKRTIWFSTPFTSSGSSSRLTGSWRILQRISPCNRS